jgi:hypothetical protein
MRDFLEIGYWRHRAPLVERVLELAERVVVGTDSDIPDLERRLVAALKEVRRYDADNSPWGAVTAPSGRER